MQYESIKLSCLTYEDVFEIVKACGKETKNFHWSIDENFLIEESKNKPKRRKIDNETKIVELLNKMPMLERFTFDTDRIEDDDFKFDEVDMKNGLNLPNLKALHILVWNFENLSTIFGFFNKVLRTNSITEYSHEIADVEEELSRKTEKIMREFFTRQKSIKNVSMTRSDHMLFADILELEKFEFGDLEWLTDDFSEISDLLRKQPKLKAFKFNGPELVDFIDALGELKHLEVVELHTSEWDENLQKLKNFKNLKEFWLDGGEPNFFFNLLQEKHENLQKLSFDKQSNCRTCIGCGETLENVPNLTFLRVFMNQKLNTFAKFLPKLEELYLNFGRNFSKIIEFDTGIVNKSLKKLDLRFYENLLDNVEEILEIFQIFPNLEELKIESVFVPKNESKSRDLIDRKFFEKLSKVKSLKTLEISAFNLTNLRDDLPQIAQELNKFSKDLEHFQIKFFIEVPKDEKLLQEWIEKEEEGKNYPFKAFVEIIKGFEIEMELSTSGNTYLYYFTILSVE